ncbi:MAG: hypothetical protein IJA23_02240 [Clostridia bacterium]|nr:hypothetical protein [Clostridia bacterium]
MIMKHSVKIVLYSSYFDMNDRLSPKSFLNLFQDVAGVNAVEIGVGYEDMLKKNLYWILSRVKFDVLKMPVPNQTVIVQTWPHEKGRIDFDRDFKILSEDGEVLVIGTSKWCVIDTESRTLQRTDNVNYVGEICPDVNYQEKFGKIMLPAEDSFEEVFTHEVRFSDLDHNKHMNNTNYALLAANATTKQIFSHFEINFLSECVLGDNIVVSLAKTDEGEFIVGKNADKVSFSVFVK